MVLIETVGQKTKIRDSETSRPKIRESEKHRNTRKRDFETHSKRLRDFEIGTKISKTLNSFPGNNSPLLLFYMHMSVSNRRYAVSSVIPC